MLSKNKRLTKELFQIVMKTGGTLSSSLFLFRYLKSIPGMDKIQTKFAFVAPKSVAKKAVDRNKLRRQGYYTLHSIKPLPKIYGIFFYKKGVKTYKYKDIKENIEFIINKIKE